MLEALSINKISFSFEGVIIQSRERDDIAINQVEEIAFEFSSKHLKKVSIFEKKATQLKHANYLIEGQVVFRDKRVIVIDVGIFIFQDYTKIKLQEGDWCTGEVHLGVDPFPMFQYFDPKETRPNIYYDCRIDRILLNETPFISEKLCEDLPFNWVTRDETKEKFSEIACTEAKHKGAFSEFIVECTLLKHSEFEPWE